MSDMLKVIEPKSDQINAEDLIGRDMTITVKAVTVRAGTEQPVSIEFNGSEKVFRPCKTVSRILVAAWGPDTSVYPGRSLTLYRDAKVKWGGMEVGGIRVRAMSHIDAPLKLALAESKKNRTITVVQPLKIEAAQSDAPKGRQTAEEWAADHIAFVVGAATVERLNAVRESGAKAMEKLAANNPPLHVKVTDAYAKRFNELSPMDDDDPFEPAIGRTDADHGDQHDATA